MKLVLSTFTILIISFSCSSQNDTITSNENLVFNGFSIGVIFRNPYSNSFARHDFGLRFTKFHNPNGGFESIKLRRIDFFAGLEYSKSNFSRNQEHGNVLKTYDSLALIRKWERSESYWTSSFGCTFKKPAVQKNSLIALFGLEVFLNISYYSARSNYGTDYLYFDSIPSGNWFAQNNPAPTGFYGRRISEYLIVGAGALVKFELPLIIPKWASLTKGHSVWYIGAKAGIQNLGFGILLNDSIDSDPDSEYLQDPENIRTNYIFRLSIARGFKLK
ncbi:MAG: hypothetical protein AB8B56_10475 [Crocinitomicaceae bacterium]